MIIDLIKVLATIRKIENFQSWCFSLSPLPGDIALRRSRSVEVASRVDE